MRLVIKTGSATVSQTGQGLSKESVEVIAKQIAAAHSAGHEVVLVSSGAIAAGVARLGLKERPTELIHKQATAAVGQLALMEAYEAAFSKFKIIPAQILLTAEDLKDKSRYENARHTILHLLSQKVVPIINENDSVSTEEIRFGDNDNLSAIVAIKIEADTLILLSDVPGLYEYNSDGTLNKDRVVPEVKEVTSDMEQRAVKTTGSKMSVGGIVTKLAAAKMATQAGIETWIANGHDQNSVPNILARKSGAGTRFLPQVKK